MHTMHHMDLMTPTVFWGMGLAVLILVVYYVFMARTVLQMLRVGANPSPAGIRAACPDPVTPDPPSWASS